MVKYKYSELQHIDNVDFAFKYNKRYIGRNKSFVYLYKLHRRYKKYKQFLLEQSLKLIENEFKFQYYSHIAFCDYDSVNKHYKTRFDYNRSKIIYKIELDNSDFYKSSITILFGKESSSYAQDYYHDKKVYVNLYRIAKIVNEYGAWHIYFKNNQRLVMHEDTEEFYCKQFDLEGERRFPELKNNEYSVS